MISLRSHIETILAEHRRLHNVERESDVRALEAAKSNIEHRLDNLNELRAEVLKDRTQFLQLSTYEAKHEQLIDDIHRIDRELGQLREELSRQKGRSAAFAIVLTVVLVIFTVIIPLAFDGLSPL